MVESSYQFFTDADFKKILDTQGNIQKDVAVAANNLNWIIENYKNQCKEIESLQTEIANIKKTHNEDIDAVKKMYTDLKAEVWKYVGVGAGAVTAAGVIIMIINFVINLPRVAGS